MNLASYHQPLCWQKQLGSLASWVTLAIAAISLLFAAFKQIASTAVQVGGYSGLGPKIMAYELCSVLIDKVLTETFHDRLSDAEFQKIRPRFYVRTRFREMNDVIEFFRDRLNLNFVWGISLNFVPHITTGVENIRWHRTPKSANSDLRRSGFGKNPEIGWSIRTTQGEEAASSQRRIDAKGNAS